jgi:hypothetical protein
MIWSQFSTLPKIYRIPLIAAGVIVLGAVVLGVFGYAVMWLWNHVLAAVLDVPSITFWQALGLFLLAKLFFGFGGGTQGGAPKQAQHKRHREPATVATTDERLPTDDLFKQYWRDEGKRAYEAYLASKRTNGDSDGRS